MSKNTKLELTWIGKEKRPRLEPRVLIEDPSKSYHAAVRRGPNDIFDNLLIHGDNLLALKALEQEYAGKVKCIYIDPPYNTGYAFTNYDDGMEHSIWLGLMRERLALLFTLLSEDGSIWISIDDHEEAYLKVMCDELFGRDNFVSNIAWQRTYSKRGDSRGVPVEVEHILVYSKNEGWSPKKLPRTDDMDALYKNPDNDPLGRWQNTSAFAPGGKSHQGMVYAIQHPFSGLMMYPTKDAHWRYDQNTMLEIMNGWAKYELKELDDAEQRAEVCGIPTNDVREGVKAIVLVEPVAEAKKSAQCVMERGQWPRFYFTSGGKGGIRRKTYLSNVGGVPASNLWFHAEVGHTDEAKKEVLALKLAGIFDTPKPERLIQRILTIATDEGDLVMDSFLGSGTTAAVAHKMGRRWIGVELGDHCYTLCQPRLSKVIDGEQGGISKAVKWQGGGGFRFYELAPTLIKEDAFGQKIINPQYDPEKLAEAVCKLEGFTYAPSETEYFIHGHSTERDFIYVTTNYLKAEHLRALSELVGDRRTLLICCKGFTTPGNLPNLTVKKIPKAVLDRCEYGHDDYSLNVKNLPMAEKEPEQGDLFE